MLGISPVLSAACCPSFCCVWECFGLAVSRPFLPVPCGVCASLCWCSWLRGVLVRLSLGRRVWPPPRKRDRVLRRVPLMMIAWSCASSSLLCSWIPNPDPPAIWSLVIARANMRCMNSQYTSVPRSVLNRFEYVECFSRSPIQV